jgi:hypothetical protein
MTATTGGYTALCVNLCLTETTLDWNAPTLWWLAAGVLVATELATGTFYLLMLALGCAAGAVAAHLPVLGARPQVGRGGPGGRRHCGLALQAVHAHQGSAPAESNRDVNLDIGQTLRRRRMGRRRHGTRVQYRGSRLDGSPGPGVRLPRANTSSWPCTAIELHVLPVYRSRTAVSH